MIELWDWLSAPPTVLISIDIIGEFPFRLVTQKGVYQEREKPRPEDIPMPTPLPTKMQEAALIRIR